MTARDRSVPKHFSKCKYMLDVFVETIENIIAVEKKQRQVLGLPDSRFPVVPRPTRWSGRTGILRVIEAVSPVLVVLWFLIGNLSLTIFRYRFSRARSLPHLRPLGEVNSIAWIGSPVAERLYKRATDRPQPELLIESPTVTRKPHRRAGATGTLSVFQLASKHDRVSAWFASLLAASYVAARVDIRAMLQTYTAFDWFLSFIVMDRIVSPSAEIWSANDHDRWGLMLDRVAERQKLVYFQHGLRPWSYDVPNRLRNVSTVYALDVRSRTEIAEHQLEAPPEEWRLLPPAIRLTPIVDVSGIVVVLVSSPYHLRYEQRIIDELIAWDFDITIVWKAHPLYLMLAQRMESRYGHEQNVIVFQEKDVYPQADLVISGPSTLGLEYELSGIPVEYYDPSDAAISWLQSTLQFVQACCR